MKTLVASIVLAVIALLVARKLVRGRFMQRVLRALALFLVLINADDAFATKHGDDTPAKKSLPIVPEGAREIGGAIPLPQEMPPFDIMSYARFQGASWRGTSGWWSELKAQITKAERGEQARLNVSQSLPASFTKLITLDSTGRLPPTSIVEASAALTDMETVGCWDAWLAGFLWRRTHGAEDPTLLALLERHHRMSHALLLASRITAPVQYVPWMKKSSPPHDYNPVHIAPDFVPTVKKMFPSTDAATWEKDGAIEFIVTDPNGAVLLRRGASVPIGRGTLRVRRLDLVRTGDGPLGLQHQTFGALSVPASRTIGSWSLPSVVDTSALTKDVAAALDGDDAALKRVERVLPLAHNAIRGVLASESAKKKQGAAALRMLLTTFDE